MTRFMKQALKWTFFPALLIIMILAIYAAETISIAAITAIICFLVFLLTFWVRFPLRLKRFMTRGWFILPASVFTGWIGWFILPNAGFVKVAYVILHLLTDTFLFFEQARLDGKLFAAKRQEGGRRWTR